MILLLPMEWCPAPGNENVTVTAVTVSAAPPEENVTVSASPLQVFESGHGNRE